MNWFLSNPLGVLSLRDHGLRMQDWHRSMGDPIYAVGSYHFTGKLHPQRDVVERAEANLEGLLANARTAKQKRELRQLVRGMHHYYPWLDDE